MSATPLDVLASIGQDPSDPLAIVLATTVGLCLGSFIATLTARWPEGRSMNHPRSHCEGCGRTLSIADLVPIISYIVQRGTCPTCGARIGWRYPVIEMLGGLVGLAAFQTYGGLAALLAALFGWQLLTLAILDWEHFWLPDRLTGLLIATGLTTGWADGTMHLHDRIIGIAAGYASLWLIACLYRKLRGREGLGGGDPKLLAGIGAWLGWQALPLCVAAGGWLLLIYALWRHLARHAPPDRLALGSALAVAAFGLNLVQ